jgi:hypothetical protein
MADLMTRIRRALGYVRDAMPGQVDDDHGDHEAALRRLEEQRIRLGRVDASLEVTRASSAKATRH